jgi:hypothetical protein
VNKLNKKLGSTMNMSGDEYQNKKIKDKQEMLEKLNKE